MTPLALAAAALSPAAAEQPAHILASYSFDDGNVDTGPDTFSVYQNARGSVSLSSAIRFSGYQSVEIRDDPRDVNFPELQGYFPLLDSGRLYAHFALLITDPGEPLNIALAGPKWFRLGRDGIAFWLTTRNGWLYHYSDSIPRRLFRVSPFSWYGVDLSYDIDRGTYDLRILREGTSQPLVDLEEQANASNQAGSRVDKFSFIGDRGQGISSVVYYVDDVVIGTSEIFDLAPFVAPGRRRMFVDMWDEYARKLHGDLRCLPAIYLPDFGMTASDVATIESQGGVELIKNVNRGRITHIDAFREIPQPTRRWTRAVHHWKQGCRLLRNDSGDEALASFRKALALAPEARLFRLSETLALAEQHRWTEVDRRLAVQRTAWQSDARYQVALAMLGFARNETGAFDGMAGDRVDRPAVRLDGELYELLASGNGALPRYRVDSDMPPGFYETVEPYVRAKQYYYYLLWADRQADARQYALAMVDAFSRRQIPAGYWLELAGDASFMLEDHPVAIQYYRRALNEPGPTISVQSKLSDVYFAVGDHAKEQQYREAVYGSLYPEPQAPDG